MDSAIYLVSLIIQTIASKGCCSPGQAVTVRKAPGATPKFQIFPAFFQKDVQSMCALSPETGGRVDQPAGKPRAEC